MITKRLFLALIITAVMTTGVSAQSNQPKVAGSWRFTVTQDDGEVFPFHITFNQDGGLVASCDTITFTPMHGNWAATGDREIAVTFEAIAFSLTLPPAGETRVQEKERFTFKARMKLTLDASGGALGGSLKFDALSIPSGEVLDSIGGKLEGTRVRVEPLD